MNRTLTVIFIGLIVALLAKVGGIPQNPSAQAQDAMPTVDQILEQYVQAIGGKGAFERLTSRTMKGTVETPATGDVPGSTEVDKKAPNKGVILMGGGPIRGFNGTVGWTMDPDEGPKDMTGTDLAGAKVEFDFYREIKLKELYPKMVVKGKEKVGNAEAYVIEATPAGGGSEKMYFDAQSGLLVREDTPYVSPDGNSTLQSYYEDYREVDGVKLPFTIRETSPDFDYVIKYTEIKHNIPIDDGKFNKLAAQG